MAESVTKRVLKAMSIFGGVQVASIIFAIVRTKAIAMWIGPMGVALFAIFNTAADMMSGLTQLDLRQSSVRTISDASVAHRPRVSAAVRDWAKWLGIVGAIVIVLASPLLSLASFGSTDRWWAFASLCVAMFALSFTSGEQALMQGHDQLKRLAKSTVWAGGVGTVLVLPMYYLLGLWSVLPSITIFALAGAMAVIMQQNVKSERLPRRESIAIGREFMRLGIYLTISNLAATGASYAFLSYLNQAASTTLVGVYQAGYTVVVKYVGLVFTALAMEYYPRMVRVAGRPRMATVAVSHEVSLLMCVLAPVVVVFLSGSELAMRILYAPEFLDAMPLVVIGVGATVFRAVSYCFSYLIIARGDGTTYVVTEVLSAAIGLAFNIVCFRWWGMAGLGVSYVAWYVIYLLIVGYVYRWRYGMGLSRRSMALFGGAVLITGCAIVLRQLGWWQPLPMLLPCVALLMAGRRRGHAVSR